MFFRVPLQVDWSVNALIDFHAHLVTSEIIGLLGGTWNADKRLLTVCEAFPARCLVVDHHQVNVEMDPASELEIRELIHERNLSIVGWYHSHPTCPPEPSVRDLENQHNYQLLFQRSESAPSTQSTTTSSTDESAAPAFRKQPFVGAICGVYDVHLPSVLSVINVSTICVFLHKAHVLLW